MRLAVQPLFCPVAIIENYHIRSRSHVCGQTGVPFKDGDYFYTCIFEDAGHRRVYSQGLRRGGLGSASPVLANEPFSHWRSKYEGPRAHEEASEGGLQKADAESLLRRMIDEDDPRMDKVRYILVVMLERKKVLKPVGERNSNEQRLLIYEHAKTGEVLMVPDPKIRLEEVEHVQKEVFELPGNLTAGEPSEEEVAARSIET